MITNNTDISIPMSIWLASDDYDYADDAKNISATNLLKSYRNIIAYKRYHYPEQFSKDLLLPYYISNKLEGDVMDRIAMRFGTAIHEAVEKSINNNYKDALTKLGHLDTIIDNMHINPEKPTKGINIYTEQRTSKKIDEFTISGQFDIVFNGELQDIKTTSTFSWSNPKVHNKYITQGSIYRWLNPELITKDYIVINFIFTDFNKFMTGKDNYPPSKIVSRKFPLWSLQETELFIENKIRELKKYWNEPLENIPCCDEEMLYLTPSKFKYYRLGFKEGRKATKNFDTFHEASLFMAQNGNIGEIVEDKPKAFYCPFCDLTEPETFTFSS